MAECCKVIVTFIGPRPVRTRDNRRRPRHGNHLQDHGDSQAVLEMLEEVCRLERELDPGISMDTVLVCNGGWPVEAEDFINRIKDTEIARGQLRVVARANTGLSFGGYAHVFAELRESYEFWILTEDDVLYVKPDYAAECREFLTTEGCHFVSPFRLGDVHIAPHCAGGVGFTRRDVLDQVAERHGGELPYLDAEPILQGPKGNFKHYAFVCRGEIPLTNTIVQLGMKLGVLPGSIKCYYDWRRIRSAQ